MVCNSTSCNFLSIFEVQNGIWSSGAPNRAPNTYGDESGTLFSFWIQLDKVFKDWIAPWNTKKLGFSNFLGLPPDYWEMMGPQIHENVPHRNFKLFWTFFNFILPLHNAPVLLSRPKTRKPIRFWTMSIERVPKHAFSRENLILNRPRKFFSQDIVTFKLSRM